MIYDINNIYQFVENASPIPLFEKGEGPILGNGLPQAHNLKVIGSNPIPATSQQALENMMFSRAFCCLDFGPKFRSWKRRGSGRRKVAASNRRSSARRNDSIVISAHSQCRHRRLAPTVLASPLDYELGGQEFESLWARQIATIQNKTANSGLGSADCDRPPFCAAIGRSKIASS